MNKRATGRSFRAILKALYGVSSGKDCIIVVHNHGTADYFLRKTYELLKSYFGPDKRNIRLTLNNRSIGFLDKNKIKIITENQYNRGDVLRGISKETEIIFDLD